MKGPPYLIVSGYHVKPGSGQSSFFPLWFANNFGGEDPEYVVIIGQKAPPRGRFVRLTGDLGPCGAILDDHKPIFMPECPCVWMIGAWLAYGSERDFIYIEQDCLAFGPWIDQMYQDMGDKNAVFGTGKLHGGSSTSLFLIRHRYIPTWCRDYLAEGPEDCGGRLPEHKWRRLRERRPEDYAALSFPFDTDRPLDLTLPVFYCQQVSRSELLAMREAGLIALPDNL